MSEGSGTGSPGESFAGSNRPAVMNLRPGEEYGPVARGFQGIPGIARASNGRLWATWYAGAETEGPDNYVVLATSDDDGRTWSDLKAVIAPVGKVRAYDPVLWIDPQERLWWFYAQCYQWWDGRAGVWAVTTPDPQSADPQWSEPRRLADGIMMNKPTVLKNGDWLFPLSIWEIEISKEVVTTGAQAPPAVGAKVYRTRDQGASLEPAGAVRIPHPAPDEHMLVERTDGSWWLLARNCRGIAESFSTDEGRTWSDAVQSAIPHVSSRFFIRRLHSGRLLLVKHNPHLDQLWLQGVEMQRSHLTAYLSADDGRTWHGGLVLDERAPVSYPDGDQAGDGRIVIAYDYNRQADREILMAWFTEADVLAGRIVSADSRLKIVINKVG